MDEELYDVFYDNQSTCALLMRRDTRFLELPRSRHALAGQHAADLLLAALGLLLHGPHGVRRVHLHVMHRGQLRVLARVPPHVECWIEGTCWIIALLQVDAARDEAAKADF